MFTALFTIAKIWKQSKCPSTDGWIKEVVHIYTYTYTMEYYSTMKKEWNFDICSNMDGLGEYYAKWNKLDKTNTIWSHVWNLKNTTK